MRAAWPAGRGQAAQLTALPARFAQQLAGLEQLCRLDARFQPFRQTLFGQASLGYVREQQVRGGGCRALGAAPADELRSCRVKEASSWRRRLAAFASRKTSSLALAATAGSRGEAEERDAWALGWKAGGEPQASIAHAQLVRLVLYSPPAPPVLPCLPRRPPK